MKIETTHETLIEALSSIRCRPADTGWSNHEKNEMVIMVAGRNRTRAQAIADWLNIFDGWLTDNN